MNPSKNVRTSAQAGSIANKNSTNPNVVNNSLQQNLIGNTVLNTVYMSQNQNIPHGSQNPSNNPSIKSNVNNNNSMVPNQVGSKIPNASNQNLSIFKTVGTGTQMAPNSVMVNNNNRNSVQNTIVKNGRVLNNIDINDQTQSMMKSSVNQVSQKNASQMSNVINNNNNYNNLLNPKAQSIHVSKDPSIMNNPSVNPKNSSALNQAASIKNSNAANLQSQKASAMQSQINNNNNINTSNNPMTSSFPMPNSSNLSQTKAQASINQSNQNIKNPSVIPNNQQSIRNKSALNNPNAIPHMSNIPNANQYQSAMINQHQNLPLKSQNMKSMQNNNNSLTPQQLQSMRQSQQAKQSAIQSQVNNSLKNQISQNPNISKQNSVQQSMKNSSLQKSDIKASRNKSPPRVVKSQDGRIVSTQSDNNGNPFYTTEEVHKSIKASIRPSFNDNHDVKKDVNENKMGSGFRYYGQITKAGRNQNGQNKTNQDTPLVQINIGNIQGFNLFGVLDGHGPHGHFVSKFCKDYFIKKMNEFAMQCLKEKINTPEGVYDKLKKTKFQFIHETFKRADNEMIKQNQFEYNFSGTTCNLVFQFKKYLVCASVGDSRGILIFDNDTQTNQGIYNLSHDHKPDLPNEQERIIKNGGVVDKLNDQLGNKVGPFRVFRKGLTYPGLAMSRSLGDFQAKECGVITEPEINEYTINHNAKFMVICSDGVWEFLSNENVRDLGNEYYKKKDIGQFCSSLVQKSVEKWEEHDIIRDDITVVCVYF